MAESWVIDTDAGVDDCQAMVLALTHEIDIKGITTVSGNAPLDQVNKNVAETLRVCDREDVPIYSGAELPFIREPDYDMGAIIHGRDGINGYWEKHPEHSFKLKAPETEPAAVAIIRLANELQGQLNIVTIGPLTNLAIALQLDRNLQNKLKRVVVMGCAIEGKGNVTTTAEFNVWSDPEAAYIVFSRFKEVEVVCWEMSVNPRHTMSYEWLLEWVGHTDNKRGQFIRDITHVNEQAVEGGPEKHSSVFFCDPFALAYAIDKTIATKTFKKQGSIELSGNQTRGMTIINWQLSDVEDINQVEENMHIVEHLDMDKVCAMLMHSVS